MLLPRVAIISVILIVGVVSPASAYFDAGTGSMLLQILLGGIGGVLFVGKLYWRRIKNFLTGKPSDENEAEKSVSD